MGVGWRMWACVAVVGVCVLPAHTLDWGKSLCNLEEADKTWLQELSAEAEARASASMAALQQQMSQVLAFMEEFKRSEDVWLALSTGAGIVERDLSNQQEKEEEKEDETTTQEPKEEKEEQKEKEKEEIIRHNEEEDTGPKKGECRAEVMDDHTTIGMFYMMSYNHGHCSNRHPITVPIRYCLGYCATKTFIERKAGIWSQGNDCKSCQPGAIETIRIPLVCDDGFTFNKSFDNVVDCKCQGCEAVKN
ncbi:uncharacterized protein LOC121864828 [Homarus americanus]|uniref:Putative DAN domain-containing protein n=1 Tax=Homarus americanus TaxID=6706 RepID=A0A8J5N0M2_HOMAM|nr:uncharacterized protein LOC121864828 [Homarus americanus]KAG7170197.1 putative DAN domain-containing protein [Homarus americanus]